MKDTPARLPLGDTGLTGEVQDACWPGSMRYRWAIRNVDGVAVATGFAFSMSEVLARFQEAVRPNAGSPPSAGTESVPSTTTHRYAPTTRDRDDNPISPTCAHCGEAAQYCKGVR